MSVSHLDNCGFCMQGTGSCLVGTSCGVGSLFVVATIAAIVVSAILTYAGFFMKAFTAVPRSMTQIIGLFLSIPLNILFLGGICYMLAKLTKVMGECTGASYQYMVESFSQIKLKH